MGLNTCTDDLVCNAAQVDLCRGLCTMGINVCGDDVDCTEIQTDLCEGACTIGTNACTSNAACVAPSVDTLFWQDPAEFGGTGVVFDTLRSGTADDFTTPATCVETDGVDRIASDPTPAAPILFYLIRVENECPVGTLAPGSSGARSAKVCE